MADSIRYRLKQSDPNDGYGRPCTIVEEGPGIERFIIVPPLTDEQCERVADLLKSAYAAGESAAMWRVQKVLGIK